MKRIIVWFRNDLRITDNTALYKACINKKDYVYAIFIATPTQWKKHFLSFKQANFIYQNLIFLQKSLYRIGIPLHYYESTTFNESINYLVKFCLKKNATNLFYNYQYEINEINRDIKAKKILIKYNISVTGFHDSILFPPKYIKNKKKQTYKSFYFFKKCIISFLKKSIPPCFPYPNIRNVQKISAILQRISFTYPIEKFNQHYFPLGEKNAIKRLKNFFKNRINTYNIDRHYPFLNSTSCISPYLSIGILSPRQCLYYFLKKFPDIFVSSLNSNNNFSWLNELIWREFYRHLLIGYPLLSKSKSLTSWEYNIKWNDNKNLLNAWKEGKTGYPIVDAGMIQLKKTGWMHNRLRMITAGFLVKILLVDWREGEKYFMSQLIDGDFANNNGGWQWIASIGSTSMPYYRIFNPVSQSKKYDKHGFFIKKFIPELSKIPIKHIHNPIIKKNNISKINDYYIPIIDIKKAEQHTISIFKTAIKKKHI